MLSEPGSQSGHEKAVLVGRIVELPDDVEPSSNVGLTQGTFDELDSDRDDIRFDAVTRPPEIENASQCCVGVGDIPGDVDARLRDVAVGGHGTEKPFQPVSGLMRSECAGRSQRQRLGMSAR